MIVPRTILCLALLVAAVPLHAAEPQVRVVTDGDGRPTAVEVLGLSKDELARLVKLDSHDAAWSGVLAVYVVDVRARFNCRRFPVVMPSWAMWLASRRNSPCGRE